MIYKDVECELSVVMDKQNVGFGSNNFMVAGRNDFNIVDATPFRRDPMKELAIACKKEGIGIGIGFGFYYS